jgi:CRP-like cAMP-binding protein/SAM-dependent methyltransferase
MTLDIALPGALRQLQESDLELLLSLGFMRSFSAGDTLYARGERLEQILVIEEGAVEVLLPEDDRYFLGPGDVFGGGLMAGASAAEESLRAASDVSAIVLTAETVEELARSQTEPAARLCLGLVLRLLRQPPRPSRSARSSRPVAERAAASIEVHVYRDSRMDEVRSAAASARRSLELLSSPDGEDKKEWLREVLASAAAPLDRLAEAVRLALGQGEQQDAEILEAARTELRPLLARSRLSERMNERAPGEPARYRSLDHIYRNQAEGDDSAGLLLDAYLLGRPFAGALRERRVVMSDLLDADVRRRARPGGVVRVLSLGCGPARALADVLDQPGLSEVISLACVDDDQEAIVFANNLLKGHAPRAEITLHQTSPRDLSYSDVDYRGFDIVASLFVADYMHEEQLALAVRHAYESLNPGGAVLLAAFSDQETDWLVADLFLNWRPMTHNAATLQEVLSAASLAGDASVAASESGLNLIIRAVRPG